MLKFFLILGIFGLFTSTVSGVLAAAGAFRFLRERHRVSRARAASFAPPVSLFKPLHGAEPALADHLATFFEQDYPGLYEILFCARAADDPGLAIARTTAALYPHIPVQFLTVQGPPYVNAKVSSLERMESLAAHDLFVISDSDVRVSAGYVREVVSDFRDPQVGAVTCLYRGVAAKGFWAMLEAAGMSVEMTAGVLTANMLEGMQFLLGPTMAVRRSSVRRMGGFQKLGPYCSDDFLLGNWIAALGEKVVLSRHVIDHIVLNLTLATSMKHQIRWMKSTRFSRPKGHLGSGLTFAVPYGILALVSAVGLHRPVLGLSLCMFSILGRSALALLLAGCVVRERRLARTAMLFPLRDLMGFVYWALSYSSGRILWRGQLYRLGHDGLMQSE